MPLEITIFNFSPPLSLIPSLYSSTVLGLVPDVIPEICPFRILVSGGTTSFGIRDRQEVPENRDSQNMAKKNREKSVRICVLVPVRSTRDTVLIWEK